MTEQQFVDVGTSRVDLHARVATLQTSQGNLVGHVAFGRFFGAVGDAQSGIHAAGTTHIQFALGLAIQVEKVVAFQLAFLQSESTGHTSLLVSGDKSLQGTVLYRLAGKDSHDGGNTHTVVGAQRRVVGIHPITHNLGLDGVFKKVVLLAGTGLRHHVHVGLQHHRTHFLHSFGRCFAQDHIAHSVNAAGYLVLLRPAYEIFSHGFFVFRRTRTFGESIKIAPQLFGFKIFNGHDKIILWLLLLFSVDVCKGSK